MVNLTVAALRRRSNLSKGFLVEGFDSHNGSGKFQSSFATLRNPRRSEAAWFSKSLLAVRQARCSRVTSASRLSLLWQGDFCFLQSANPVQAGKQSHRRLALPRRLFQAMQGVIKQTDINILDLSNGAIQFAWLVVPLVFVLALKWSSCTTCATARCAPPLLAQTCHSTNCPVIPAAMQTGIH